MKFPALRKLFSLLAASALIATFAVAAVPAAALAAAPSGSVIFDNTPTVVPSNLPSYGVEAYSFNEWGAGVTFAGTARKLSTATVTMSSWACQSGAWNTGDCVTTPGATYAAPITFNVYSVGTNNAVGSLIATSTQEFQIPFRPSADTINCTVADAGKWFTGSACKNGLASNVTFTFAGQMLPANAIFGIAYNTDTNGYVPLHGTNSPMDSLNIGTYPGTGDGSTAVAPSVGSWLPDGLSVYASNNNPFSAFAGPTTSVSSQMNGFGGYEPAVQITALPACTATDFFRDGIYLTAARIGGNVTGDIDATGCNIGAYFNATNSGSVGNATIHGANYYGVVANGVALNLTNSTIRNIGEVPFNGAQHGNAVMYINGASGTISGNTISSYQKNGITVSGKAANGLDLSLSKTIASVLNNVVTGQGKIDYIAQNGIQISYGASATVKGNTVSDNYYTPTSYTACGLLFYQAGGVKQSGNVFSGNETNICNAGRGGGKIQP